MENPVKGYFARALKGSCAMFWFREKCIGCDKDADGNVTAVHCEYYPDSNPARLDQIIIKLRVISTGSPVFMPMRNKSL